MKILAIESSGLVASVAVIENNILLGEYTTNQKKTHSQTLLPMLDELCPADETSLVECCIILTAEIVALTVLIP